ncbi:MAG: phosphoribosylanthranilate isomerase [Oscillospiraceae bacterium]
MTKIKICGLTTDEDIELINRARPDLAGFVLFFPKSRRNLDINTAKRLISKLDGIKSVAVVVSPTAEQVSEICSAGFDFIQIHGELFADAYDCCNIPILRAFNVSNMCEFEKCSALEKTAGYVFDAAEPGSGKTFDWGSLSTLKNDGKMRILAGGLSAENVGAAIAAVRPDGVDVSSGVERSGGGKSEKKVMDFISAVKRADRALGGE